MSAQNQTQNNHSQKEETKQMEKQLFLDIRFPEDGKEIKIYADLNVVTENDDFATNEFKKYNNHDLKLMASLPFGLYKIDKGNYIIRPVIHPSQLRELILSRCNELKNGNVPS